MDEENRNGLVKGLVEIIVEELKIEDKDRGKITRKTTFDEFNADSLDVLYVEQAIEDKYKFTFPDGYYPKNLGELSDYIEKNKKEMAN